MNSSETSINTIDKLAENMLARIRKSKDELSCYGNVYYVSNDGSDENDGTTPDTAWATLGHVSRQELREGDAVLFRRGDLFRGWIATRPGVAYGAYGEGEKPRLYGWDKDLASPELWELYDERHSIWRLKEQILDPGTLVLNHGERHSIKLIPSYIGGRFVCRDNKSKPFVIENEMVRDLDIYWHFDSIMTTSPSKGESFPVPEMGEKSFGTLYLRCDSGNPGEVFLSIEALTRRPMFSVHGNHNVTIDNLCIKYVGLHAIAAGGECVRGLKVTNCEIGWIGGTIQHYLGTDPNYPEGGRGTVTRFGNGVEIYGGCLDYEVSGCYFYQIYDAAITHQVTTNGSTRVMKNILYKNNLVDLCVYSIEYFLDMTEGDEESYMENLEICGNILRRCGYGWGQQRHNVDTPAHIKGWSYKNKARNFIIHNNVFDRSRYRLLHLVARDKCSCPEMRSNVYIQKRGALLGQYGPNAIQEPPVLIFDHNAPQIISNIFGDKEHCVHLIDPNE